MFFLNQIFKFMKLLHSETGKVQLASGIVLGMFMGFTPLVSLAQCLFLLCLLCLRINIGAVFISMAFFKALAFIIDPQLDLLGGFLLRNDAVEPLWTILYNMPVIPYTFFYNTIVMGSLTAALIMALPVFFLSAFLIQTYRVKVVARFKATWLFRAWMSSKLYPLYVKYTEFKNL